MQKKLIIWDFDGVIADTEKLWLLTRQNLLNEKFNLGWDFAKVNQHLGGMSDKTKKENLDKLGIRTGEDFWQEAMAADIKKIENGIEPTKGVMEIFQDKNFAQCIATGGIRSKTNLKIDAVGIKDYFPDDKVFTADMVEYGKPEPDLFLLAAQTMGYRPQDCIVIEDSLAGMTAGLAAGMTTVAYLGCEMNRNQTYAECVKNLGIEHIFYDMAEFKSFLDNLK